MLSQGAFDALGTPGDSSRYSRDIGVKGSIAIVTLAESCRSFQCYRRGYQELSVLSAIESTVKITLIALGESYLMVQRLGTYHVR